MTNTVLSAEPSVKPNEIILIGSMTLRPAALGQIVFMTAGSPVAGESKQDIESK